MNGFTKISAMASGGILNENAGQENAIQITQNRNEPSADKRVNIGAAPLRFSACYQRR